MKKTVFRAALTAVTLLCMSPAARAQWIVFDPTNFGQNIITAAKAVQGEIYQNTNIVYQYQMMANQLLQATGLNPVAMKAQYDQIQSDIKTATQYTGTLTNLYGSLQQGGQYISRVQNLIATSGKSPTQWLSDMNSLYKQGDAIATNLFQTGNTVNQHIQTLAQRRADLQSQLSLSPTQQATASLTTHYLDIVSSQNNDLLQMMSAKTQSDAQTQAITNESAKNRLTAAQAYTSQQDSERAKFDALPTGN
ncbi:DUF4141 domain-containing protein [Paraburkholderia sp. A3BS-1L]|uniref:DUF4141 domain-containing protein n=1 Tax=Paraburkholderia sp. A3BS-1L TaxID=3028375 RepID=UPI003DAA39E2